MTKDRPRIWHLRAEGAPVATLATPSANLVTSFVGISMPLLAA